MENSITQSKGEVVTKCKKAFLGIEKCFIKLKEHHKTLLLEQKKGIWWKTRCYTEAEVEHLMKFGYSWKTEPDTCKLVDEYLDDKHEWVSNCDCIDLILGVAEKSSFGSTITLTIEDAAMIDKYCEVAEDETM